MPTAKTPAHLCAGCALRGTPTCPQPALAAGEDPNRPVVGCTHYAPAPKETKP